MCCMLRSQAQINATGKYKLTTFVRKFPIQGMCQLF